MNAIYVIIYAARNNISYNILRPRDIFLTRKLLYPKVEKIGNQ
jgi:hypothetical protein